MKKIYLISCVKSKTPHSAPARELYSSVWFKAARRFVESQSAGWFILSAEHGLVHPEQLIKPYEATLNRLPSDDRRLWAKITAQQIEKQIAPGPVVFLAGKNYREYLIPLLEAKGYTWEAPLARLGIGSQVSWLQNQCRVNSV